MRKAIIIFAWLWVALVSIQTLFPNLLPAISQGLSFGTASYPTSLDTTSTLPNPGATDSVATVSHSSLHTNENGAIEAVEAKLGITASTPLINTVLVGSGTGSSVWSTFATTTNLWTTNLFVNSSSTLQNFTFQNMMGVLATTTSATTTNLYSSGLASTTSLRANSEIIGDSNIGRLTVTSCTGCSTANATWYIATSSTNRYFAKTLNLSAGDVVMWWGSSQQASDGGVLSYRITSPWSMATVSPVSISGAGSQTVFQATTTETITFAFQDGSAGISSMMLQLLSGFGFANQF